jgi:regulator-associated protein of mTOR
MPSSSRRPSSAPGDNQAVASSSRAESGNVDENSRSVVARPTKPPLLRSKSEHRPRYDEADDDVEEEYYDLGARHGFEDHYLSEDIIAQLANVSDISVTMMADVVRSRAASALLDPP